MGTTALQFGKCILDQKTVLETIIPYRNLPYDHSPYCSLKGTIKKERKIQHASVGVISDSKSNLLITRRNKNLPTFPCCWVFPGGRVDKGENFEQALLREIEEETGISVIKDETGFSYESLPCKVEPLLIYESIYPNNPNELRSQVLIIYYAVTLPLEHKDIKLQCEIKEVDGYVWINQADIYSIIFEGKKMSFDGFLYNFNKKTFDNKVLTDSNFTYSIGKNEYLPHGHMTALKILHLNLTCNDQSLPKQKEDNKDNIIK